MATHLGRTRPVRKNKFDWRHEYDTERDQQEGDACRTFNDQDSLTQQSFSIDADINVIVQRLGLDRQELPPAPIDPSYYGDVSNVPDLRAILDQANDARNRFMELPAKLRARFHNEPSNSGISFKIQKTPTKRSDWDSWQESQTQKHQHLPALRKVIKKTPD